MTWFFITTYNAYKYNFVYQKFVFLRTKTIDLISTIYQSCQYIDPSINLILIDLTLHLIIPIYLHIYLTIYWLNLYMYICMYISIYLSINPYTKYTLIDTQCLFQADLYVSILSTFLCTIPIYESPYLYILSLVTLLIAPTYLKVIWTLNSILTSSTLSMLRIIRFTAMLVAPSAMIDI